MKRFRNLMWNIFHKGDMILLILCIVATIFGIVMISAVVGEEGSSRNMSIQIGTLIGGVILYLFFTAFDIEILSGQRTLLFLFNFAFIGLLLVFGIEGDSGNKSWLDLPVIPFNIQPAEVCKITYIILLAKTMSLNQTRITSLGTYLKLAFHAIAITGFNLVISRDLGVSLIYIFIFICITFLGGTKLRWFLASGVVAAAASPFLWEYGLADYQKQRIMATFDKSIDPTGWGVLWQTTMNEKTLRAGGLTGLGLFNGKYSDSSLPARHTDSIFSAVGEQLGFFGCIFVLLILLAIVARVFYIAMKTEDYTNRLICIGIASMLLFQIMINVGVCLGLVPVIGLALPFISYGATSIVSLYAMLGLVSGVFARPSSTSQERYVKPPYMYRYKA